MSEVARGWGPETAASELSIEDLLEPIALEARLAEGAATHLVLLAVDASDYDPRGGEPVYAGDAAVGVTTSDGHGHATGSSYAFAYVATGSEAAGTELAVALLGDRRPAVVLAEPAYDAANLLPRA